MGALLCRYGLVVIVLCVVVLNTHCYLIKQGMYILRYNRRAVAIDALLAADMLSPQTSAFLSSVLKIKKYAVDTLGLHDDNNYTKYVHVDKSYIVDVVAACKDDRFEQYQWWYPIFGDFPYKGYFERDDAEREAKRLERKGYDVYMREVDAFSTLGFFSDPIYSFMTDYSLFSIASLIIHEQTHATVFLKNQVQFNEEIASFIGREGALKLIADWHGDTSALYRDAVAFRDDYAAFVDFLKLLYNRLDSLYSSELDREKKLQRKDEIYARYQKKFGEEYETRFTTDRFRGFSSRTLNNAYLTTYMTYTHDLELFYRLYRANNYNLIRTVEQITALENVSGDPKEYLREHFLASPARQDE
jgi:predicted aminopeptidase